MLATPGATAIADRARARDFLVADALRALPLVEATTGLIVDVGSGNGTPGIPLAVNLPNREVTLLEAERRKCDFLERTTSGLANVTVVWGRAEEQPTDTFGVALAKALARPPVAAELCLPLVAVGGVAILWVGVTADLGAVARATQHLAADVESSVDGLVVLRKTDETPAGFPRRPGAAKKRPLA